jgi:hypothetical protein
MTIVTVTLWEMMLHALVDELQCSGGACCLCLGGRMGASSPLYLKDGGCKFLQNIGTHL